MITTLEKLLDRSIELELSVSKLYRLFSFLLLKDKDFWTRLSGEEINHASLLRSIHDDFLKIDMYPKDLLKVSIMEIEILQNNIKYLTELYKYKKPCRVTAFTVAYRVEHAALELHYQKFMSNEENKCPLNNIFIKLNNGDMDHARRISEYMDKHNIR